MKFPNQAWVIMTKPERSLKMQCSSAGLIIATAKKPANSKPFRLTAGSQKSRATQAQAQAQAQGVCYLPSVSLSAWATATQKKSSQTFIHKGRYMVLPPTSSKLSRMCTSCMLLGNQLSLVFMVKILETTMFWHR
jgi:hypothetical protein